MENLESLIKAGAYEEAIELLSHEIDLLVGRDPDNERLALAYFQRGKLYWKLGLRSKATSDYTKSAHIYPSGPASKALEQARDVESFFNPDLYNP